MADLISVIVATYNREDALDAVLRSLIKQTDKNFEIVVADDGSGAKTATVVEAHRRAAGMRLDHVWQEDKGFRLAEIRNRAILAARGDYCVFLDGDCIARPDFIARHRALAEPGWFVCGSRVLLSRGLTARVLAERLAPETWPFGNWLAERRRGGINRLAALLHLPLGPVRKLGPTHWQAGRGGNVAIAKRDLVAIDGFDAAFSGWGREDSDIFIRLMRHGVHRKDGRFAVAVLHLWHSENDRSLLTENESRLRALIESKRVRAERGLSTVADDAAR